MIDKPTKAYVETTLHNEYKATYKYMIYNYKGEFVYSTDELNSPTCYTIDLPVGVYYDDVEIISVEGKSQKEKFLGTDLFIK